MLHRALTHRLFVVPLANNDHGKTQIIRAVVQHGGHQLQKVLRGPRPLTAPSGRVIDALIIPRSYQETLEGEFGSIEAALDAVDARWRERDLIILPSNVVAADCATIISLAHASGFDAVAASVLLEPEEIVRQRDCLILAWNERWTLCNTRKSASPEMKAKK